MSDSDSIHSTDVPPPVPPKDDIRPALPPKDLPKAFSFTGPSNSSDLNDATTKNRTKRLSLFPALGSLFTPSTTKANTNDVPRISSHSESINTANVVPITISSTSSSATSLIAPQTTDDGNDTQSPKVKRSKSITNLFRKI
ncbi:13843_t:CDS:2, partial [Racocetra fulgida]